MFVTSIRLRQLHHKNCFLHHLMTRLKKIVILERKTKYIWALFDSNKMKRKYIFRVKNEFVLTLRKDDKGRRQKYTWAAIPWVSFFLKKQTNSFRVPFSILKITFLLLTITLFVLYESSLIDEIALQLWKQKEITKRILGGFVSLG